MHVPGQTPYGVRRGIKYLSLVPSFQVLLEMTSIVWTLRLLLAAVAVMASVPRSAAAGKPGPGSRTGTGSTVTRFVCAHCTATGLLSSCRLFHNRAAVKRHISASRPCRAEDLGFREIHVDVWASDVMAGGGGAAGPAQDVRLQQEGNILYIYPVKTNP